MDVVAVIMAGGVGTRFWPASTRARPKQFLRLIGERTLLQESYERASTLTSNNRILVLTSEDFVPEVRKQLPLLPALNVIGEPARRDTAGAVALASLVCRELFGDVVMVVLTADHWISPLQEFQRTIDAAVRLSLRTEAICTIGVTPGYPATGYGYLHCPQLLNDEEDIAYGEVSSFREKPDLATAAGYVASGEYWWNSGMFVWSVGTIMRELEANLPEHLRILEPAIAGKARSSLEASLAKVFPALPAISIDYAVMEKAKRVHMVRSTFAWSDLGGWTALEDYLPDEQGNKCEGRTIALDAVDNVVFCEDRDELVALLGVHGLVVARAAGRTLVADKRRAEDVKKLVALLEERGEGRDL